MNKIFSKKLLLDKELEGVVGGRGYPFDVFPPHSTQDVCFETANCTGVQLCGADVTVNVGNCDGGSTNGACFNTQQC